MLPKAPKMVIPTLKRKADEPGVIAFIDGGPVEDAGAQVLPEVALGAEDLARLVVDDPEVEAVLVAHEHLEGLQVGVIAQDGGQNVVQGPQTALLEGQKLG